MTPSPLASTENSATPGPDTELETYRSGQFTDSQSREESRLFLQARLARFGYLLSWIFGSFMAWRIANSVFGADSVSRAYVPWQALSVASFLSVWLICRGKPRSYTALRTIEALGLSAAAAGAISMCLHITYTARPDFILLLCLSYTLIGRAIMVPSTARRTFVLGLVFAVPFLIAIYFIHRNQHDPAIYTAAADPRLRLPAEVLAVRWTMVGAAWWTAATVITTATSKVIYGLQQEVRDARRMGQYTLIEKLGQGGMGIVYRASHALLRRPSALKLLPPDKLGPASVARFEREVQLTARLTHPNTIRIFDYGRTPDGIFYYVMEYLDGASLDEVIATTGAMPPGRVIHILDQVAGALREAHGVGLIHRDIKPGNIFLTQQGGVADVAKVLDFGLVKQLAHRDGLDSTATALTHDDHFTGTPMYMAPEAITEPERIDARADLYALGAVGYFLLTGQDVFTGRNIVEICSHHLHSAPVAPSSRAAQPVPADLEALILGCLAKRPEERPADARAMQTALRACADAGRWTETDAQRFFELHAETWRAKQVRSGVRGTATIAIDLGVRRADAASGRRQVG
ncbi:MAG: serine/threonine-protein kinase [Polyangiales bacterium]